jgi:hypothetical protein
MQIPLPAVLYFRGSSRLRMLAPVGCLLLLLSSCTTASADQMEELIKRAGIRLVEQGSSATAAQKSALAAFPSARLSATNRDRAEKVLNQCTQYRRLPSLQYTIDEPLYRYLLEHPDVAVSTWRAMGISQFQMWQTGPQEYEASAADGSEGIADILYRDASQIIFICEGSYHNLLLPAPLEASALIWFRTEYKPHAEGTHIVTQSADVFVHFPSAGVAGVAKVLTPVTSSLMDRNLYEVSLYAVMMSRAVRNEPEWIVDMSASLDGVLPQRRTELAAVAQQQRATLKTPQSQSPDQPPRFVDRWVLQSPEIPATAPPAGSVPVVSPTPARKPTLTPIRRDATTPAAPLIPRSSRRNSTN